VQGPAVLLASDRRFRACWAAAAFDQTFDPSRAEQGRAAMMEQLRDLSEEDIRQLVAQMPPDRDPERTLQVLLAMKQAMQEAGDEG
jgi:hypothetical protein